MTQELFPDPFSLLPPIFRDCVTDESTRFCLEYPQPIGDFVYATDGRILVRVPATPEIVATLPKLEPKRFPADAATMFGPRAHWLAEPTPLPSLDHLERCKHCEGKGSRPEHRCSCVTWDDSEAPCHGKGVIPAGPCYDCDGTGIDGSAVRFLELRKDVNLGVVFLHILTKHGATVYLPVETNTWESVRPVYFTVDGGAEGVLMPALPERPPYKRRKAGATS